MIKTNEDEIEIKRIISLIHESSYIIALTGAGMSTESGVPDFRGPSGLWKRVNPEYATYTFLKRILTSFGNSIWSYIRNLKTSPLIQHIIV